MKRLALVIMAGTAFLAGPSCAPDKDQAPEEGAAGDSAGDEHGEEATAEEAEPSPVEPLADGSHSVFGLRVPRGMKPAAGPNRVYRFEGTFELPHVKRYVMRQVETGHLHDEPTGYLIRKARVVDPVGTDPAEVLLAVRIFRGRRGGATMDVWVETESLAALRRGKGGSARGPGAGGANKGDEKPPAKLTSSQRTKRQEERKSTFEALEAAAQGKRLPRDPENPLNY